MGHRSRKPPSAWARARLRCAILAALAAALLSGCAAPQLTRVKPWQRGYLADPVMDPNRDPLGTALSDHVYFSREAAQGGRGVGGAGCGCN